jgi:aminopeptidase-like protein
VWMRLDELKPHLFSLPDQPDLIPYRTSYYAENWGFCLPHRQLCGLPDGMYEVLIDADLEDGSLTYGEYLHRGETEEEVLLSAHVCHPSLANDNCSGVALLAHLAKRLDGIRTYYSYRFLFAPGTIGAIAWLARNEHRVNHVKHGLVVSCVGDAGGPVYKKSRRGDAVIDRAMAHVLHHTDSSPTILEFAPYGYDERQFCSPGFDLPVGLFQRSQFGTFPEYHTSADDLDLIGPDHLAKSYAMITAALEIIDCPWRPRNTMPRCEPQLGRRGLYAALGGDKDGPAKSMALLWILNLADGSHTLLDMAERSEMPFSTIMSATRLLESHGLVKLKSPECQSSGK